MDASNRKDVRRAEKKANLADAARISYTRRIMSESLGRQWIHQLLESCYTFSEPFVRGAPDATGHNLGRQAVGKQLFLDIVTHCPTEYILMTQEASHKEIAENVRHERNDRTPTGEPTGSPGSGRDLE